MPTTLPIYQRSTFGVMRYYAADAAQAAQLSILTAGQPSLTQAQVKALVSLGFAVKGVPDPRAPQLAQDLFALGASLARSLPHNPQA